jgi:hypothetical protein
MPRRLFLAILLTLSSACSVPSPELARGLPRSFGPTSDFDQRVKERFPVGSDQQRLSAELRRQRFSNRPTTSLDGAYEYVSYFDRTEFPCRETWTVLWSANLGSITAIAGRYSGDLCL